MYLKIESELQNKQIGYTLSNEKGVIIYLGIRPYRQLLNFKPHELSEQLYMTIVLHDKDRLKLYNAFVRYCKEKNLEHLTPQLRDIYKSWNLKTKQKEVVCLDTGEMFESAIIASRTHDLTYGALLKHLKKEKSYITVKGRKYEYVS